MAFSSSLRGLMCQHQLIRGSTLKSMFRPSYFLQVKANAACTQPLSITANYIEHKPKHDLLSCRHMSSSHNHVQLWRAERALSVGMLGLIPAAFLFPCPALDYALAVALVMHSHWGIEAVLVDYVRPAVVGAALAKLSIAALYAVSIMSLGGLFYFTYSDVGLASAIKMLWKL